jgi:hypothetical protein
MTRPVGFQGRRGIMLLNLAISHVKPYTLINTM